LSRLQVPPHLADMVRRFASDFTHVTAAWVRDGWHAAAEVEEWRAVIRQDMQNELCVGPVVDLRSREERIRAWCKTFAELADKMDSKK
jgi:hypothetical protein